MMDTITSRNYEWLPWVAGNLDAVPKGAADRKKWLRETRAGQPTPAVRAILAKWSAEPVRPCAMPRPSESAYGTRPDEALIRKLFPFLPKAGD